MFNLSIWLKSYQTKLLKNGFNINVNLWLLIGFIVGIVLLFVFLFFLNNAVLGIVIFLFVFDLFIGYPLYLDETRISQIEKHFPNALREISYLLKTGGTYEYAIREISTYDYGPLNYEFEKVLLRLEQGYNFEESLSIMAEDIDSDMVKKTISIIADSIKSGAALADVLEDLAEDVRQLYKLELDRKAKTTMQFLFIFAAGAIIAPAIYGLVVTLIDFLMGVSSSTGLTTIEVMLSAKSVKALIENVLLFFVFIQALASSLMVVIMREKKFAKFFIYFPLFLICAYVAFFIAKYVTKYLLIGVI